MPPRKNLLWETRNHLTVIGEAPTIKNPSGGTMRQLWCRCDCGRIVAIRKSNFMTGNSKSCGRFREYPIVHGMRNTPEFHVWSTMKDRCNNKNNHNYDRYGGRGIKVCDRWLTSFLNFYKDMGPRPTPEHSIDRIDNNGDYTPKNCRWVTAYEQCRNRKTNVWVEYNGKKYIAKDLAKIVGVQYQTFIKRIHNGWAIEEAVVPPVNSRHK